ncbi:MAG: YihY/virulence factor BrkB family protein [Actinomycetota bacterium]
MEFVKKAARNPVAAYVLRVQKGFSDDAGGYLAAAITYYAFLSLFPLSLLALSALGFFLASDANERMLWAGRLSRSLPALGPLIEKNFTSVIRHRRGSGIIGLVGLVWSGLRIVDASSFALGRVFETTRRENFFKAKYRSVSILGALGAISIISIAITGAAASLRADGLIGGVLAALAILAAFGFDLILFTMAYRLLTPGPPVAVKDLWRGALFAALGWNALKVFGAFYVSRTIAGAAAVYGSLAAVVSMLGLIFLAAQIFIYGAEINADAVGVSRVATHRSKQPRRSPSRASHRSNDVSARSNLGM